MDILLLSIIGALAAVLLLLNRVWENSRKSPPTAPPVRPSEEDLRTVEHQRADEQARVLEDHEKTVESDLKDLRDKTPTSPTPEEVLIFLKDVSDGVHDDETPTPPRSRPPTLH